MAEYRCQCGWEGESGAVYPHSSGVGLVHSAPPGVDAPVEGCGPVSPITDRSEVQTNHTDTPRGPVRTVDAADRSEPWPLRDVLTKLADAADILLRDHDYDGHGHEEIAVCRDRAREIAAQPDRSEPDPFRKKPGYDAIGYRIVENPDGTISEMPPVGRSEPDALEKLRDMLARECDEWDAQWIIDQFDALAAGALTAADTERQRAEAAEAEAARLRDALQAIASRGEVFDAKGTHSKWVCGVAREALAEQAEKADR